MPLSNKLGLRYPPQAGDQLVCEDGSYSIVAELGQGAFGYTYRARPASNPALDVVIKLPRLDPTIFGHDDTFLRQEEVNRSFHNEINALKQLSAIEGVAQLLGAGASLFDINGVIFLLPWLVYEYVEGTSLDKWMKLNVKQNGKYSIDASMWFRLAQALISRLERIHQERVVHGDIWPPNIILCSSGQQEGFLAPVFIDFGKGWLVDRTFDSAAEHNTWHPYWAPERFELANTRQPRSLRLHRTKTRWYAPADWYSLGITLYLVATGPDIHLRDIPCPFRGCAPTQELLGNATEKKYIFKITDQRYRRTGDLRDTIISGLKTYNPLLYYQNAGIVDIIMSCIRPDVERRIHHAAELRQMLEAFDNTKARQSEWARAVISCAKSIKQRIEGSIQSNPDSMFLGLIHNSLKNIEGQLPTSHSRVFVQAGGREELVSTFVTFLSQLGCDDRVFAITTATFWRDPNMGSNGRALTMLRIIAERGASVRWIVCIDKYQRKHDKQVEKILAAHRSVMKDYYDANPSAPMPDQLQTDLDTTGLFLGHLVLSPRELDLLIDSRRIGILVIRKNEMILVAPDHSKRGGELISLRFWLQPNRQIEIETEILLRLAHATPAYTPARAASC